MPTYQQITRAREKSKRIREIHFGFRRDRAQRTEDVSDIRQALHSTSASKFVAEVLA
jgi:hypothetical protein